MSESIILSEDQYQDNIKRTMKYHDALLSDAGGRHLDYLMNERKLSLDTIKRFYLGAVLEPEAIDRPAQGRISIPIINARGPVAIRFRALGVSDMKYWSPAGTKTSIYNVVELKSALDVVTISEGECLPGSAEVLTPNGWSRFDELDQGTPVAQYTDKGKLEMVIPQAYVEKQYDGDLVLYENSQRFHSLTTPGHGIPGETKAGKLAKAPASEGHATTRFIPRAGTLDGPGSGLSRDLLALMLAISADASIRKRGDKGYACKAEKYYVFGFTKVRKIERLIGILNRLGIVHSNNRATNGCQSICFSSTPEIEQFDRLLPNDVLLSMSLDEREFCLKEMVEWDGNSVPNRNQVEYSSKYEHNAQWMQTLAHTTGRVSTVMPRSNDLGSWYKVSVLHGKRTTSWQGLMKNRKSIPFSGKVYCVQVPSGFFLVRQNGCITVTGNCDTMVLTQCGIKAVGISGSQAWKDHYRYLFEGLQKVYVAGDGDDAGQLFAAKVAEQVPNPHVVALPQGKDINDVYIEGGVNAVRELFGITESEETND